MKKILSIIMVALILMTFVGCVNQQNEPTVSPTPLIKDKYRIDVIGGDINCQATLANSQMSGDEFAPGTIVEIVPTFFEGFELAYWYTPTGIEVATIDNKHYVTMPNADIVILAKSQKIGEPRDKKQYRFELQVVNGGTPGLYFVNDYYDAGDKITWGFRPVSENYGNLTWQTSSGKTYDYKNFDMPNEDLILTATYEKIK